jgi:hypothetical protein
VAPPSAAVIFSGPQLPATSDKAQQATAIEGIRKLHRQDFLPVQRLLVLFAEGAHNAPDEGQVAKMAACPS